MKRNFLKVITLSLSIIITAIFGASPIKALLPESKIHSEKTLEGRLTKVRQKLQQQQDDKINNNFDVSSSQENSEVDQDKTNVSQWGNWSNYRTPWNNWSNWGNWGNWGNY
ncbi:MAG: hypothetical protein QNJ37_11640 [Crocosphaera sp.]|nr:hypothetical protein [Crocosphaera sp.]